MKPSQDAIVAASKYLRFKLGGRRGCRVLEDLSEELQQEIIEECATAFQKFASTQTDVTQTSED